MFALYALHAIILAQVQLFDAQNILLFKYLQTYSSLKCLTHDAKIYLVIRSISGVKLRRTGGYRYGLTCVSTSLPSYCYDMHTRVGLKALQRIVRGIDGAEGIRDFFQKHKVKNSHRALGEALFFMEGGRIKGELVYEPLCFLEQRVFAHQYGFQIDTWWHLQDLLEKALKNGVVDRVRQEVLQFFYGTKYSG